MSTRLIRTFLLFAFALLITAASPHAHAQTKVKKLDADNVTAFIEKTTAISNGKYGDLNTGQVKKYLQDHLHDQARFISEMTYVIPGFPPQATVLSLEKEEFMTNIEQSAGSVEGYENSIEIIDIVISKDKRTATVKTRGNEEGAMQVTENGEAVSLMGNSDCTQILMLSKKNVIQMFNARCKTTINFGEL